MSYLRIHVVVGAADARTVERAVGELLGEPTEGKWLRSGGSDDPFASPEEQRDPYPGAAVGSWQGERALAEEVAAAVLQASPTAVIGRGALLGVEDVDDELGADDAPTLAQQLDPRESLERVYARWAEAHADLIPRA